MRRSWEGFERFMGGSVPGTVLAAEVAPDEEAEWGMGM